MRLLLTIYLCVFLVACSEDDATSQLPVEPITGTLQQSLSFGGSQQDDFLDVAVTANQSILAFGFTQSTDGDITDKSTVDSDYWLVKFDQNLNLIWQKTFGGSNDDRGQGIASTRDGGCIVSGFSRSNDGDVNFNNGFQDMWIVKLDAAGNIQWETSIGFQGNDRAYDVIQTQDGGYFVSGFLDVTASGGQGNDDFIGKPPKANPKHGVGEFWGIQLNAQGEIKWRRYYGGSNNDRSYAVIETSNGEIIQAGHSESEDFDITNPNGSYDGWLVKSKTDRSLDWQTNLGGSGIEIIYDLIETTNQNLLTVGDTRSTDGDISNPLGNADAWINQVSENGQLNWSKTYGGTAFDSFQKIINIPEQQTYAIAGYSRSNDGHLTSNYGQNDIWLAIINQDGSLQLSQQYGGSNLDFGNSLVYLNNHLYIVGSSQSNDGDFNENKGDKDAVILKIN